MKNEPKQLVKLLRRQKRLLRVALMSVKVDHLNKKVQLPLETHALMENTLSDTAEDARKTRKLRERKYAVPKFKIRHHRNPRSVLRAFTKGSGRKLEDITFEDMTGQRKDSAESMMDLVERQGLWGFTETRAKPPVIHIWHDGLRSEEELTMFFGHEMGHNTGEHLEDEEEEYRADDYGHVAVQATKAARRALSG